MRLGVVCGLARERRCLERAWPPGEARPAIVVAPGLAAAETARALLVSGAEVLVSFGIAGGLDPSLAAGTVVVAEAVGDEATSVALDGAELRRELQACGGRLLGVDRPLADPRAKAAAAVRGFVAVDMETLAVARAARLAGRRVVAVRAIADPARRALPHMAAVAIDAGGRLRPFAVIVALAARPWEWPLVVELARDVRAAERGLGHAAEALARLAGEGRL